MKKSKSELSKEQSYVIDRIYQKLQERLKIVSNENVKTELIKDFGRECFFEGYLDAKIIKP